MQMKCIIWYAEVGVHWAHSHRDEIPTEIRSLFTSPVCGRPHNHTTDVEHQITSDNQLLAKVCLHFRGKSFVYHVRSVLYVRDATDHWANDLAFNCILM